MSDFTYRFIAFIIGVLLLSIVGCNHYQQNIVPMKMAENGYCWKYTPTPTGYVTAYQPCEDK